METIDDVPYIEDVLSSNIYKFITSVNNYYRYTGSTQDLMINWVHPMFLKEKSRGSKG